MAEMKLAHTPGLIGGRMGDGHSAGQCGRMQPVHLRRRFHPPTHPHTVDNICPAGALTAQAQEDSSVTGANAPEFGLSMFVECSRFLSFPDEAELVPTESAPPTQRLEPYETVTDARNVEHRRDTPNSHTFPLLPKSSGN